MTSARYLELATIEEVANKLRLEGYAVTPGENGSGPTFDLIAEKPGRKIACEVKAKTSLREAADELRTLRQRARKEGFDFFRLVVASPPHRTQIEIEGFSTALVTFLKTNPPPEIVDIVSHIQKTQHQSGGRRFVGDIPIPQVRMVNLQIEQVDFDRLDIHPKSVHAIGDGVVGFALEFDTLICLDGTTSPVTRRGLWDEDDNHIEYGLPFRFDLTLDRENQVIAANQITVDTSSFYEDNDISHAPEDQASS
jgi:hypothetical protein